MGADLLEGIAGHLEGARRSLRGRYRPGPHLAGILGRRSARGLGVVLGTLAASHLRVNHLARLIKL